MPLGINRIGDPEIVLRNIKDAHVLYRVRAIRVYEFDHAKVRFTVTTTTSPSRSEKIESTLSGTPHVFDEAAFVVLPYRCYQIQVMRYLHYAIDITSAKAFLLERRVSRHDGLTIIKAKALELRDLAIKMTSNVRPESPFVAIMNLVIIFNAAFDKEQHGSFFAAGMVDFVDDNLPSTFLSRNGSQTYQQ